MEELDQGLVGTVGRITVPVTRKRTGEVVLPVRGGTEAFEALSDEPLAKNTKVVVVDILSARSVQVAAAS